MAIGDIIVGIDIGTSKVSLVIGEVNNFNQISFTGDDIYLNGSVYVNDVNLSNVYTGGGGLFNTSTALLINGNALNSNWAQLVVEYNGLYFGI